MIARRKKEIQDSKNAKLQEKEQKRMKKLERNIRIQLVMEEVHCYREASRRLNLPLSTICRVWKTFKEKNMLTDHKRSGRPSILSGRDLSKLERLIKYDPCENLRPPLKKIS